MVRIRVLIVGLTGAALLLAGCTAAEPEPEELTVTAAGARYLEAVCPVNEAWDAVDVEVERLRIAVARGEAGDTGDLGKRLATLEAQSAAAAETLADPSVAWPGGATPAVESVAKTLADDAEQAGSIAELEAQEAVDYRWDGAATIAETAAAARAALGLPEDPVVACAAR